MKYIKSAKVARYGGGRVIFLTEPLNLLKWEDGDEVRVSVTEDDKIIIERLVK